MFGFRGKAERQPENNPDEPDAWNGGGLLNGRFLAYQARDVLGNLTKSESFKVLVGNDTVEKAKKMLTEKCTNFDVMKMLAGPVYVNQTREWMQRIVVHIMIKSGITTAHGVRKWLHENLSSEEFNSLADSDISNMQKMLMEHHETGSARSQLLLTGAVRSVFSDTVQTVIGDLCSGGITELQHVFLVGLLQDAGIDGDDNVRKWLKQHIPDDKQTPEIETRIESIVKLFARYQENANLLSQDVITKVIQERLHLAPTRALTNVQNMLLAYAMIADGVECSREAAQAWLNNAYTEAGTESLHDDTQQERDTHIIDIFMQSCDSNKRASEILVRKAVRQTAEKNAGALVSHVHTKLVEAAQTRALVQLLALNGVKTQEDVEKWLYDRQTHKQGRNILDEATQNKINAIVALWAEHDHNQDAQSLDVGAITGEIIQSLLRQAKRNAMKNAVAFSLLHVVMLIAGQYLAASLVP